MFWSTMYLCQPDGWVQKIMSTLSTKKDVRKLLSLESYKRLGETNGNILQNMFDRQKSNTFQSKSVPFCSYSRFAINKHNIV